MLLEAIDQLAFLYRNSFTEEMMYHLSEQGVQDNGRLPLSIDPIRSEKFNKAACRRIWLAGMLARRPHLLVRFAAQYERLRQLPRRTRRRLGCQLRQRMALGVAGAALLLALGHAPARAANIAVVDGEVAIDANGDCSLVEAIINANDGAQTYADCAAGDAGADTITLPAGGAFTLTAVQGYYNESDTGLPQISSEITIAGNGATITRGSGAPSFRLWAVAASGDLTLNEVTLSGGDAAAGLYGGGAVVNQGTLAITDSTLSGNSALNVGGAITNYGTATISNSTFSDNAANAGGSVVTAGGTTTISNSTLSGNTAGTDGGGVANFGGTTVINNSTLSGNTAGYSGGGVINNGGTTTISSSTLSDNTAYEGGGVFNLYGTTEIINSTLSGNTADFGGGVSNVDSGSTMEIINSTLSDNTASNEGGGMWNGFDSTINLQRSLVSGNTAASSREVYNRSLSTINANNDNLFGESSSTNAEAFTNFTPGATDLTATSDGTTPTALALILHTTLAANGGPTETHLLLEGGPAIDAAPSADCQAGTSTDGLDQRGEPRNFDADGSPSPDECDIGAVERQAEEEPISFFHFLPFAAN